MCAIALAWPAGSTLADDNSDARFFGGTHDGYDEYPANNSWVDWPEFKALLVSRMHGGERDGYALAQVEDIGMSARSIIFKMY